MRHATSIRFCSIEAEGVVDVEHSDKTHVPILSGGLGWILNDFAQYVAHDLQKRSFNFSVVTTGEIGAQNGGNFTGCAGHVQRNESDIVLALVQYPLDDYDNVFPYQIMGEGKIMMISGYKILDEIEYTDIIKDGSKLFSLQVYIMVMAMILFLGIQWKIFSRFCEAGEPRRVVWEFFSVFIGQCSDFIDSYNWSRKMLFVCLGMFSFFIINIWSTLLSTDSIVIKKAAVINTYQDFLDRHNLKPMFSKAFSDHLLFQNAPKGSPPRKIWERIPPDEMDKYVMERPSFASGIAANDLVMNLQGVFFINSYVGDFVINTGLRVWLQDENNQKSLVRMWKSFDPGSHTQTMGMIMRTEFRDTWEGQSFIRLARRAFDTGVLGKVKRNIDKGMMTHLKDPPIMREFASSTVVTKEVPNLFQTQLRNLKNLIRLLVSMCCLSAAITILEIMFPQLADRLILHWTKIARVFRTARVVKKKPRQIDPMSTLAGSRWDSIGI